MASQKNLRKLKPRGAKARFAVFAGRTKSAVGQFAKRRLRSPHLEQKLREWNPAASEPAPIA